MTEPDSVPSLKFRLSVVALSVVVLLAILCAPGDEALSIPAQRLAAVGAMMAVLWSTQAVPLAVTSLIPLAAFPFLGIQPAREVSGAYMNATILLYFSGFAIAIGVEKWGLHRRLALLCLTALGTGPKRIVLGFMLGTGLLSMWISNTAATLLMLPIALAVLLTLESDLIEGSEQAPNSESIVAAKNNRFALALLLGIAYAASIGGMCTLIGTPTNGVYAGYWPAAGVSAEELAKYKVSSGQWFLMFAPISVTMFAAVWLVVCLPIWRGFDVGEAARQEINRRSRSLGKMSIGERRMFFVFLATATLWMTRDSLDLFGITIPGWQLLFSQVMNYFSPDVPTNGLLHDSTAGLLMLILMFIIPVPPEKNRPQTEFLMNWELLESKTPWGILLLFGGGFAIAGACSSTGLSAWLGEQIAAQINQLSDTWKVLSVSALIIYLTEFTSNTATISTLLPILEKTARALQLDPRLLMLPATIASSCAFMLPIATPPNAIVFSSNRITVWQMIKVGFWLNLVGIVVITFLTMTWVLQIGQVG